MRSVLFLAYKYIVHNYTKTIILTICLVLTTIVPLAAYFIIENYQNDLKKRAKQVTLIAGKRGNDYDILLRSLYYKGSYPGSLSMKNLEDMKHVGKVIPMYLPFTGHKLYTNNEQNAYYDNIPIIGTHLDYFSLRKISLQQGRLPSILGEAVVGASTAQDMNIQVGDFVLSDQKNLYDISASYPLKMKVVGILRPNYSADDNAIFVDIKTTWIIQGIFHGHDNITKNTQQKNVVISKAKIYEYPQVTLDNLDMFHHHGKAEELPITTILIIARDHKSKTILLGDYQGNENITLIQPLKVIDRLMSLILRVHAFFKAYFILVITTVSLFLVLIIMLSIRIRTQEFQTLSKMGCSYKMLRGIILMEFILVFVISIALSTTCVFIFQWLVPPQYLLQLFTG
ncbi:ABC transporter permease [Candidatus Uabimicrobium sp. HlEnr_7]|uniref:ABC transporter permease n=1 Tax=Candidatus Uabimicrobium helgolandensis TaxID=3095367 RepID=UPI003556523B